VEKRHWLIRYACLGSFVFLYAMLHAEQEVFVPLIEPAVVLSAGLGLVMIIAGSMLKFTGRLEPPMFWKCVVSGGLCVLIPLAFVFLIFSELH
jgi:hypothetical protein